MAKNTATPRPACAKLFASGGLFLSSFLIDFDHYACSVLKTRRLSLFHAFHYHEEADKKAAIDKAKGIKERGDFHLFHTIEFHIFIGLLSLLWIGFFYIFLGMIFHSLIDLASLLYDKEMYKREFFLINWFYKKFKQD